MNAKAAAIDAVQAGRGNQRKYVQVHQQDALARISANHFVWCDEYVGPHGIGYVVRERRIRGAQIFERVVKHVGRDPAFELTDWEEITLPV